MSPVRLSIAVLLAAVIGAACAASAAAGPLASLRPAHRGLGYLGGPDSIGFRVKGVPRGTRCTLTVTSSPRLTRRPLHPRCFAGRHKVKLRLPEDARFTNESFRVTVTLKEGRRSYRARMTISLRPQTPQLASHNGSCLLARAGRVECWGPGGNAQLGDGRLYGAAEDYASDTPVRGLTRSPRDRHHRGLRLRLRGGKVAARRLLGLRLPRRARRRPVLHERITLQPLACAGRGHQRSHAGLGGLLSRLCSPQQRPRRLLGTGRRGRARKRHLLPVRKTASARKRRLGGPGSSRGRHGSGRGRGRQLPHLRPSSQRPRRLLGRRQ